MKSLLVPVNKKIPCVTPICSLITTTTGRYCPVYDVEVIMVAVTVGIPGSLQVFFKEIIGAIIAEEENYANPLLCFFHVLFKGAAIAFYILFSLFVDSFVIIFVVTVLLAAFDFWVVKNVSGRKLVGLRWWNEINDQGESIWRFESLDQDSLARMNKKDSWLFWWTLYLNAAIWLALGIVSLIKFNIDYLLVVGVCLTLSIANIVGFTKCRKDAKKQVQNFASTTFASHVSSTLQSAFNAV